MCDGAGQPADIGDALGMLDRALSYLATADAASLPSVVQAEALRTLARAEAKHTAARARVLGAFAGQGGFEDDGHASARAWVKWQTRVTHGSAVAAVAWARRLATHPVIAAALAAGELSPSWARHLCDWTDRLPEAQRGGADEILTGAARGGADLAGLAGLAREMYERCCQDGGVSPEEDRFGDRWFRLGITFRGAGRAEGDLTPGCAAALGAVLEALGKKAGPEDARTSWQRRHDALEEACRRLIRAGMVPARAGQPTQVLVHLSLAQLRGIPGASAAEDSWAAARAAQPGWLTGPDAEAALCDATVVPVVTGHVDWAALRRAVTARHPHCAFPGCDQPASVCDIHHIIPRSRGGPTSLPNLVPLCGFHHLTAIHRWGWTLTLRTDGTTTATSPDGTRTLHSHGPPGHGESPASRPGRRAAGLDHRAVARLPGQPARPAGPAHAGVVLAAP